MDILEINEDVVYRRWAMCGNGGHKNFSLVTYVPRYTHLAVQVSATTISVSSGSFGLSFFQIQTAMFSLVGFSSPETSFR